MTDTNTPTTIQSKPLPENAQLATFAGGCFWCMEPAYQERDDVIDAVVGYAGGDQSDANYGQVARGQTQHREAVQVTYNPDDVSYETLLEVYWPQINPTDAGGQFADRGLQYTTAIYYHTPEQQAAANTLIEKLNASEQFDAPIAVLVLPYSTFFMAEDYHQDYYKKAAAHCQAYKKGSGRADFIEENWARAAALERADAQQ